MVPLPLGVGADSLAPERSWLSNLLGRFTR